MLQDVNLYLGIAASIATIIQFLWWISSRQSGANDDKTTAALPARDAHTNSSDEADAESELTNWGWGDTVGTGWGTALTSILTILFLGLWLSSLGTSVPDGPQPFDAVPGGRAPDIAPKDTDRPQGSSVPLGLERSETGVSVS